MQTAAMKLKLNVFTSKSKVILSNWFQREKKRENEFGRTEAVESLVKIVNKFWSNEIDSNNKRQFAQKV